MAKLILSMDGLVLKEIPLTRERTSIGRKPHNDIQIDNLAVSGEHAVIVTILNDSFLEDLGSTNGTVVNGNPIKKHFLQNNDVIELGKYKLKFVGEAAPPPPPTRPTSRRRCWWPGAARAAAERARRQSRRRRRCRGGRSTRGRAGERAGAAARRKGRGQACAAASRRCTCCPCAPGAAARRDPALSWANAGRELELTKTLTTLGKPSVQVAVLTRPQGYFITHVERTAHRKRTGDGARRTRSRTTT